MTTLNLYVQTCESNNHYILIMESRFKRKIFSKKKKIDLKEKSW